MRAKAVILSETKEGTRISASSSTISTRAGTALEIWEKRTDKEKNLDLIGKVVASGHKTVIEHHYFNLAFENVSVFVEQFLIEFRLAAYTIKSRRYVNFSKAGYNMPTNIDKEHLIQIEAHVNDMFKVYDQLVDGGINVEDARFVLPYAFASNIYASMNTRQLVYLICNMIYGRGKHFEEIYDLGLQLKEQLEKTYPNMVEREKNKYKNYALNLDTYPTNNQITFEKASTQILQAPASESEVMKHALQLLGVKSFNFNSMATDGKIARLLEHFNYTVAFKNLTLSTLTHLVRHRIQSISVPYLQTFAYSYNFIMPPKIEENKQLKDLYLNAIKANRQLFEKLKDSGCAPENLIYITLSGATVDVISTLNTRELHHVFKLRTCTRAQWEIMDMMTDLLFDLRKISPGLFNKMGASCYTDGACPEGKFSCGRMQEIQEKFSKNTI